MPNCICRILLSSDQSFLDRPSPLQPSRLVCGTLGASLEKISQESPGLDISSTVKQLYSFVVEEEKLGEKKSRESAFLMRSCGSLSRFFVLTMTGLLHFLHLVLANHLLQVVFFYFGSL